MDVPTKVRKGLRFRSLLADTKALYEVKSALGRGYWECVVVNEPIVIHGERHDGDFAGRLDSFHSGDILGKLRIDAMFGGYDPARYEPKEVAIP